VATAAAKRYARAVFELAQQKDDIEQWARRLAKIRELFADPIANACSASSRAGWTKRSASRWSWILESSGG